MVWAIGILNYVLFYLGWVACIYGAAIHEPWMGYLTTLVAVPLFFYLSVHKKAVINTLIFTLMGGFILDTSFSYFKLIHYESQYYFGAPLWILCLYAIFATSIDSSLKWLQNRIWLAIPLGFISGPLSYRAAAEIGAITFLASPLLTLLLIGALWTVFLPAVFFVFNRSRLI